MSNKRIFAEIKLENALKNMEAFKNNINKDTRIIAVIKADGYGHGSVKLAHTIENLDYLYGFAVATAEEALELRNNNIKKPILILGYTFNDDYEELIKNNVTLCVFTKTMLKEINEAASKCNLMATVHIKVDTGMSRIGVKPNDEGLEIVKYAVELDNINVEGMFTHFSKADEIDKSFTKKQIERYLSFNKLLEENGISIKYKHISNSAGIIEVKDANLDIVRAGITLYGLWPSNEVSKDIIDLHPLMTLKSSVVYVKTIDKDTMVSYGGTYCAKDNAKIATIPCGYADGIPRGLSNKGQVLIHGKRCNIVGRVCMDQFMVDVSHIDDIDILDEVVIIGTQGNETITAEEVGDISGRFNYELVCEISKRVPRIYI